MADTAVTVANATKVLSDAEVAQSIDMDLDMADTTLLTSLSQQASSFLFQRTGYDWGKDDTVNPLAVQCCSLYVAQSYFRDEKHDFQKSIDWLLGDLQDILKAQEDSANAS